MTSQFSKNLQLVQHLRAASSSSFGLLVAPITNIRSFGSAMTCGKSAWIYNTNNQIVKYSEAIGYFSLQ